MLAAHYAQVADTSYMNVDTCIRYTYLALPLLAKTEQWELYVRTYAGLSYCYNVKGLWDSLTIVNLAASAAADKYLPSKHPLQTATQNNLGITYRDVHQNYPLALEYFESALKLFDPASLRLNFKGSVYKNIGEVYVNLGEFNLAERYFQDAFTAYTIAFKDPFYEHIAFEFRIAEVHQYLAQVAEYQGNYIAAEDYLHDMLRLMAASRWDFDKSYYLYAYIQLAEVLLEQDDIHEAKEYLQRAFRLADLTPDQKADLLEVKSKAHAKQEYWTEALSAITRSIDKMSAEKLVNFAERHRLQAHYLAAAGKLQEGLVACDTGLSSLSDLETLDQLLQLPTADWGLLSPLTAIQLLKERAEILQQIALAESDVSYTQQALESYRYLSDLGDELRRDYQSEESKLFLGSNAHNFYETAIDLAYQAYQQTEQQRYLDDVFFFFERSKAAVLLEELRAQEAEGLSAVPEEVLQQGQELKVEINYYRKLISAEEARKAEANQTKLDTWNSELLALIREREDWEEALAANYPKYQTYTRPTHLTLAEVQAQLPEGEGMVSYFAGQQKWYAFFISHNTVQLEQITQPQLVQEQQQILLANLKLTGADGINQFARAAAQLHDLLLAPFPLDQVEQLVVIPDGQLAFLPFDLLLSEPVGDRHLRAFPYLFRNHSIRFAYSWAVLQLQEEEAMSVDQLLWVAPIFAGQQGSALNLTAKPPASTEDWQPVPLADTMATRANFSRLAHQYHILHFASHATAYDSVFGQPAIDFFDAPLHLRDLYSMRLSAHLVVLSACEAGIGDVERGEGMMSLARGFAYAGVPSVVSTLWRVNESSTQQLMEQFYYHLARGESKDNALRLAKLDFLEQCSDIQLAPYYWAGLVAIGDGRPITAQPLGLWWLLGLGALLAVLALIYRQL
ncbi:MAG: CHAT domain-containing protein [Bacteroidota bacterium]